MEQPQQEELFKDGPQRIKELLQATFGDYFKNYYLGEPEEIAADELPCVMISEKPGQITSDATMIDRINETILITLALNKLDDLSDEQGARQEQLTERKLQQLIKAQDPVTGQYKEKTVAYTLRKNYTMKEGVISSRIETDFDINVRGENAYTQEAYVTVYVERLVYVGARQ